MYLLFVPSVSITLQINFFGIYLFLPLPYCNSPFHKEIPVSSAFPYLSLRQNIPYCLCKLSCLIKVNLLRVIRPPSEDIKPCFLINVSQVRDSDFGVRIMERAYSLTVFRTSSRSSLAETFSPESFSTLSYFPKTSIAGPIAEIKKSLPPMPSFQNCSSFSFILSSIWGFIPLK